MLNQLLKLWAEREPENCKPSGQGTWEVHVAGGFGGRFVAGNYPTTLDYARVEYKLREAIQARGWEWVISNFEGTKRAKVFLTDSNWYEATHHEPAIALLRAYLMALWCDVTVVEVGQ